MKIINKINSVISKFLSFMMIILFIGMTIIYAMQVFVRYVLNKGFTWTEELTRYGMIWIIFLGTAWIVLNSEHIKVSIIEDALKGVPKKVLMFIQDIICLAFMIVVFYYSFPQLKMCSLSISANTGLSNVIPYLIIPISMVLSSWGYICRLIKYFVKQDNIQNVKGGQQ